MRSRGKNITIEIMLTLTTLIIACVFCPVTGNAKMTGKACNALVDEIIKDRGLLNDAQDNVTKFKQIFADASMYDSRKYTLDDAGNDQRIKDMTGAVIALRHLKSEIASLTAQIAAKEARWDQNCKGKIFFKKKKP